MTKTKIHYGVRGRRLKILPDKDSNFIPTEDAKVIKMGKVIESGPESVAKKGDTVVFTGFAMDKIEMGGIEYYYVLDTDQFILEILK